MPDTDMTDRPFVVGVLLIPGFALLSYAAAVEPLRAANILSARDHYRWLHIVPEGQTIAASNGLEIVADHRIGERVEIDMLLVCAGGNPAAYRNPAAARWLRSLRRRGVQLGGVSGGTYLLARSGLLEGRRCTIHWEHAAAFAEEFPALDLRRTLFEIDGDRLTSAGGIAALDMMVAVIAGHHGRGLSRQVSDWFLQTQQRTGAAPQRMSIRDRTGVSNARVISALELMERHVEEPLSPPALAAAAGVSTRQLERLFAHHLGRTIGQQYRDIRLERGRALLDETSLPIIEVAAACGFVSASHFSRAYAARYGLPPGRARGSNYTTASAGPGLLRRGLGR
jgi:transcriptional regulator GlxA family with amidase domain